MSISSLLIASLLLLIPIFISYKQKLNLEKELIISVLRAVIQLVIVGFFLEKIFNVNNFIFTSILILIMIFNAAYNAKKRGNGIKNALSISFIAILIGTVITLSVLVISGAISYSPNDVIPVSGMIISNSMVAIGLSYRNLHNSFKEKSLQVETMLSLGSDINMASKDIIRDSIKTAIVPSIDSAKTLGIVSLPGMMTGLILAGASPLTAIKFQIMVTFMILSSTTIATLISTSIAYKSFFNDRCQLKL